MEITLLFIGLFTVTLAEFIQLSPDQEKEATLALENPDLYEGDIAGIDGSLDIERNAIPYIRRRWPNATIPYVIHSSLRRREALIMRAMDNYHNNTCVRFVPRTDERNYVILFSGQGCYSCVGKINGQQRLSLGNGCHYFGTIIHELGHAVGFDHEHNRSDRDEYLIIYLENVAKSRQKNFRKLSPQGNILYNTFDYDSIMIYDSKAFSMNGKDTMVARNGQRLFHAFKKPGMTKSDIERVNKLYKCESY
ncbi:astacin-like metalloprotease toxin 5 [Parasteatoda tepidariorum]|uniref:astacin-like metalloprotease toxin 5 n=1 Tax=Parasteatoda tepidariorum TaxID=114398 RepID=UPI00077F814D|nr:astacin-like metalloprotease toxin 5 [Parasteatoda tepidariorum]